MLMREAGFMLARVSAKSLRCRCQGPPGIRTQSLALHHCTGGLYSMYPESQNDCIYKMWLWNSKQYGPRSDWSLDLRSRVIWITWFTHFFKQLCPNF